MNDVLLDGFKKFKKSEYKNPKGSMEELVKQGQDPETFIISCIDSRTNPGTIFKASPGMFFGHKAMGAIVRPYKKGTALAAALQFALIHNNVKKLIVMGHTGCGAIKAMIDNVEDEEISSFIAVAKGALAKAEDICGDKPCSSSFLQRECEEQVILQSVENLKEYPSVSRALEEKRLLIHPWLFNMEHGEILEYNNETESFESLEHT